MHPTSWGADALGVLMAPFTGTTLPPWLGEVLDAGLASVILFGHNTPDVVTAQGLARAVHARPEACLVAIDGRGVWLGSGLGPVTPFGHRPPDVSPAAGPARAVHARAEDCLVPIDEEGGAVPRPRAAPVSAPPTAWALGEVDDTERTRHTGHA